MMAGVPGNFLYLTLPDRIGRRGTFVFAEVIQGISCIGTGILLHFDVLMPLQVVFSMLMRLVASITLKNCYLVTAELYPTQIRNTVIGIGSVIGGIGSILGLLLEIFSGYWISLPIVIVGSANALASLTVFLLPETKGAKLPETLEDIL